MHVADALLEVAVVGILPAHESLLNLVRRAGQGLQDLIHVGSTITSTSFGGSLIRQVIHDPCDSFTTIILGRGTMHTCTTTRRIINIVAF